ncbi:hypothetical protein [Scytonema sp. PCC 10023]|uniref:hypothetical protein n=1 Tax=Scytonema sp. PCC 10023 TaxID=1680591 RepID=UPI0039C5B7BC
MKETKKQTNSDSQTIVNWEVYGEELTEEEVTMVNGGAATDFPALLFVNLSAYPELVYRGGQITYR